MPNYWGGLIEGFQGRREQEYLDNYARDAQNRQLADRVFSHLLASRDPQMQELALRGLMAPTGQRKGGLQGFLGATEDAASPILSSIVARMNEMVPDDSAPPPVSHAPQSAATPGSAAMPTSTMVDATHGPIALPPAGPFNPGGGMDLSQATAPPELGGPAGGGALQGMAPAPPPELKMKRRGTGVPDAFEIAEFQAKAPIQARLDLARANLPPDQFERAALGIFGAPQTQRQFSAPGTFGVEVGGQVVPVSFDFQTGQYFLPDGKTPVPNTAKMVRMTGGGGLGPRGTASSMVQDSAEARQDLIALGADPAIIANGTTTGYWRVQQVNQGGQRVVTVQPGEFVEPPAYAGTTEILDNGVPVRAPILRSGGVGRPVGDVDNPQESETALDARALVAAVDAAVELQLKSLGGRLEGVSPQQRDTITAQKAQQLGLPYRRYDDALRVATASPKITAREAAGGGTMAERVRRRAQQLQQDGTAPPVAPPSATPRPGWPSQVLPGR